MRRVYKEQGKMNLWLQNNEKKRDSVSSELNLLEKSSEFVDSIEFHFIEKFENLKVISIL